VNPKSGKFELNDPNPAGFGPPALRSPVPMADRVAVDRDIPGLVPDVTPPKAVA
jgi:hypothetical protein